MITEMAICNTESSSFSAKRKRKRRNGKHTALCDNNDTSHKCPEGASLMQDIPLERASCVESTVGISSESGLVDAKCNSNLSCLQNKKMKRKLKKKKINAPNTDNTDLDLQEVTSETMNAPFSTEAPVKCPEGAVLMQDMSLERGSYVESTGNISSEFKVQSTSDLSCLQTKKKRRRPKKKKRCDSPKTDNSNVNIKETTSESISAPLRTEASVDMSLKKVSETASLELKVLCETSTKMDLAVNPVKTGASVDTSTNMDSVKILSRGQKKSMRKKRRKETLNNSATTNIFPEKDSSLHPPVNICSKNLLEKNQHNEHITLCLEKNERKKQNDDHNASENNGAANFQMVNDEHFGKEDVKYAPEELGLISMKEDPLLSKNQSGSPKSAITNLMEEHDIHFENHIVSSERINAVTYHRKKKRKSSKSLVNSLDCIKEDGTTDTLFDHSEEAHTADISKNKLDRVLELENAASVQVLGDIMIREASANSSDGQPAGKNNEKINNSQGDISGHSSMKNVAVPLEGHFEQKNIDKPGENLVTVQNESNKVGASDESSSDPKGKKIDNASGHDTFCKHLKQKNMNLETKTKEIFPSSNLGVIKDDGGVEETGKKDNLPQTSLSLPERACIGNSKKKLLVLDVNGLLVDIIPFARRGYKPDRIISKKAVFKRPYCDDFLQFCFERFNVGVWSSRIKKNVASVVEFLMGDFRHSLLFSWDASHCTKTGLTTINNNNKPLVFKELSKLWEKLEPDLPWEKGEYNETNTLLLDDSPYKALRNPAYTAVFPYSYDYKHTGDFSLAPGGDLRLYLEGLALAENVQEYVRQNPFGQEAITESNPSWSFYSKVIFAGSSQSHDAGNTSSLANKDEVHNISGETLSQTDFDPK